MWNLIIANAMITMIMRRIRVVVGMSHLTAAHFHLLGQNVTIYNFYIFILSLIIIEQGDDGGEPFEFGCEQQHQLPHLLLLGYQQ